MQTSIEEYIDLYKGELPIEYDSDEDKSIMKSEMLEYSIEIIKEGIAEIRSLMEGEIN
ncbi:hypothetical protein ACFO25_16840 [Paenactinomyces guangxiensis]|uniref:Uncharacterized protein n=1 Tax=Paenactinomyces guangxiensis TaxID=1490290 RepID=A0A7W1WUR2_9BACL|nr:hypothetical protein [Paenactinomyces guangxiensis]MBA4496424.1 hypothetical protein [Paenactinomyces guangxiensis]MBH8593525.1 hypothetical protein [Paenactinomyces guangxiensis]